MTHVQLKALTGALIGVLLWSPAARADVLARLTEASGDVTVQVGTLTHAAKVGEALEAGDTVRAGAQASATVTREDGSVVDLMAFAELTIEDSRGFWLKAGKVWSHFMKATGDPFFIRTPNATALIRGTTLSVGYEAERSRVVVVEGLVEVRGRESRMDVPAGFRLDVDRAGRVERLERAEARDEEEGRIFRIRRGLEGGPRPVGAPTGDHPGVPAAPGIQGDRRQILAAPGERREPVRARDPRGAAPARDPGERAEQEGPRLDRIDQVEGGRGPMLERRERLLRRMKTLMEQRASQAAGDGKAQQAQEEAAERAQRLERTP